MSTDVQAPWQAFDEQFRPTRAITWDEARLGTLHGASHVWIWKNNERAIEVLLQRRAKDKATWGGHLDISAAGHIDAGETALEAAIRETKEEIGLEVRETSLFLVNVHRARMRAELGGREIIENEFQFVYLLKLEEDSEIRLEDGEVDSTHWLTLDEFEGITRGISNDRIVPHGEVYYSTLLDAINYHARV